MQNFGVGVNKRKDESTYKQTNEQKDENYIPLRVIIIFLGGVLIPVQLIWGLSLYFPENRI